jgi:4-alpha-glucanotransferase
LIAAALAELGVKRFLLAIHDVSFPSDADEDIGRGAPSTRAAARLFDYAKSLGFTGVQLGPQGQTDRGNPSPYDSTIFSRHLATIAMSSFRAGGPYAGAVADDTLDRLVWRGGGRAQHVHAFDASRVLVHAAYEHLDQNMAGDSARFASDAFLRGDVAPEPQGIVIDTDVFAAFVTANHWLLAEIEFLRRERFLSRDNIEPMQYALGQWLAHQEHTRVRSTCARLGLALYGDLQVGYSYTDAMQHVKAFLPGYFMGAPPSRTNPDGQAWNYPVLDPDQLDAGNARALLLARIDKMFADYDSVRIDHPHGLACPWIYRAGDDVKDGTRLYESPADPVLGRYAIARESDIDRARPRYHDNWVQALDDDQVSRYARLFDLFAGCAVRNGRAMADVSCEVLSTMP